MKYIILFFSLSIAHAQFAQNKLETLPEFNVSTLEGEPFSQDDVIKDSNSFLIYFDPTCSHCIRTFKLLNIKSEQLKKANVQIYTISGSTAQLTRKFFEDIAPRLKPLENLHILKDKNYAFADAFQVGVFPSGFLYDKKNKLIKTYEGVAETVIFLSDLPE